MKAKRIVPLVSALAFVCGVGLARADQPAAADNTGVNSRDRSGDTLTASDQPNNKADVNLTAAVRQSIVNDDKLSMSAHNVKVIAMNGVVTLRGPVDSAKEKAMVAEKAKSTAGVTRVDNQLEVAGQ